MGKLVKLQVREQVVSSSVQGPGMQGRIQDLCWGKSSAEGTRIEVSQVPTVYWGGTCKNFPFFARRDAYFFASSRPSEYWLLHCNTSRSRPPVRLPSLTFQAACGSIKGAGVTVEENTEHYLSCRWIRYTFHHCQRRKTQVTTHDDSYLQRFFRRSWVWGHEPLPRLDPPLEEQ